MHWAAHGQTAAEIIANRVNAKKPNMGLTSWARNKPSQADTEIAKNYLNHSELDILNRLVSMYLDFAELQAMNRRPMYMQDWINKLDEFLRLNERELLTHTGKISHQQALEKAHDEYIKYRNLIVNESMPVEKHFEEAVQIAKRLEKEKP